MSITQLNSYSMGDNTTIPNLIDNVLKLGLDKTFITYSGGNFLVKVGSLIEANGKLFIVDTSDISIVASSGVLAFNSSTATFSISASSYTFDPTKGGFYISSNVRACGWLLSSTGEYTRMRSGNAKRVILTYNWADGDNVDFSDLDYIMAIGESRLCSGSIFNSSGAPSPSDYQTITSKITKIDTGYYNIYGWAYGRSGFSGSYTYTPITIAILTGKQGGGGLGDQVSRGTITISC